MNKNYMPEVAKMLGVEINGLFDIIVEDGKNSPCGPFYFDANWKIRDNDGSVVPYWFLEKILTGEYTVRKRPWRPKEGERCWRVLPDGDVGYSIFDSNRLSDILALSIGNCFPTEAAASAAAPEMLAKFEEIRKGVRE